MKTIADFLEEQPFFKGLSKEDVTFIAGCGVIAHFKEGEVIAKPGDPCDYFYVLLEGRIALIHDNPLYKPFEFETLGEGEIVGISWLIPPYRWLISAKATHNTRTIKIDGACLRKKCDGDSRLGYELMKRLSQVFVRRMEATSLHLLDIYGKR